MIGVIINLQIISKDVKVMIVVYHDVGGTHSSATAANIHINRLPMDRVPNKNELLKLPTFDKLMKCERGHLMYIGEDEFGNKVYTLMRDYRPELVVPAIADMYALVHGSTKGLYLVNTSPAVNNWMKVGGFSSRRAGLVTFGRPIVTHGTIKTYFNLVKMVKDIKGQIRQDVENNTFQ